MNRWSLLRGLVMLGLPWFAALVATQAPDARGQVSNSIPDRNYYPEVELIYRGDYRQAQRAMLSEWRGAIKTADARWIDSICYHAFQGEAFYQMGQYEQALGEFDRACSLVVMYPNWMLTVKFQRDPRPDPNPARRLPPWGPSQRQPVYCVLPDTMLLSQGQVFNQDKFQQGGVVQSAQFWKLDVIEVLRTSALAIRRRNELLGPLAPHDRLSRQLADTLGRGGLAPPNHWSGAWIDLLAGIALEGTGDAEQALPHLARATLLDGRYDHRLTGVALLEQGRIAMRSGASRAAASLFQEAATAALTYGDLDVLCEAVELARLNHIASGGEGLCPLLDGAIRFADRERLGHLRVLSRTAAAEDLLAAGAGPQGAAMLAGLGGGRGDWQTGRLGPRIQATQSMLELDQGRFEESEGLLGKALMSQRSVSLRNFHIALASAKYDSGELSPRIAVAVLGLLLDDPTPEGWVNDPLDCIAALTTDHSGGLDRWFDAALRRDDVLLAVTVSDAVKRRRFFAAQPHGGRLTALRRLLAPTEPPLPAPELGQRQALLARLPELAENGAKWLELHDKLSADPGVAVGGEFGPELDRGFRELAELVDQREQLLRRALLQRTPTTLSFPPKRTAAEAQARLAPGQALFVLHQTRGGLYGFLLARDGYHNWALPDPGKLEGAIGSLLQGMGNFGRTRTVEIEDLGSSAWRRSAEKLSKMLVTDASLDLDHTSELIVVPDGAAWHVPFEALPIGGVDGTGTLIDKTPVRYAPTIGLALRDPAPARPVRRTAVLLAPEGSARGDRDAVEAQWERLSSAVEGPVRWSAPAPAPTPLLASVVQMLVTPLPNQLDPSAPQKWSPAPIDRNLATGRIEAWEAIPGGGPQRLVLTGMHTAAGDGLKPQGRRSKAGPVAPPGRELFQAACSLMASGVETALVSRWVTGGATQRDLEREYLRELPFAPASAAWRRAVTLTRNQQIDAAGEPRVKAALDHEAIAASHPFFWGGYLLFDSGIDPRGPAEGVEGAEAAEEVAEGEDQESELE